MAARTRKYNTWQVFLLLLIVGGIIGSWLGETVFRLSPGLRFLGQAQSLGLSPFTLDLHVFTLTFGFMLYINFFTLLGFMVAYFVFRKL